MEHFEDYDISIAYCADGCGSLATEADLDSIALDGKPIYELICLRHKQQRDTLAGIELA